LCITLDDYNAFDPVLPKAKLPLRHFLKMSYSHETGGFP
jgi:hypothetical protein